jgi:hypothetical protein
LFIIVRKVDVAHVEPRKGDACDGDDPKPGCAGHHDLRRGFGTVRNELFQFIQHAISP